MSSVKYEFRYMPLIGKLPGESMLQQTEQAINEIAEIVNENTAQADIINTLAQDANDNSVEALEKANEALETSGRVYINESVAVNLDSYCESQLIYIGNVSSTNLPILSKGFLEVKTNESKTESAQIFTADSGEQFNRTGTVTAQSVGDVVRYVADYGNWSQLANINSPAFTGTPTAPTPANGDNSTKIATTAFVKNNYKFVKLSKTFNFDFTNKNGWINTDTDGNTLSFTLPTGTTEVLAFSLVSSGAWTNISAWQVTNSYIFFSFECHHPNASYSGTATVYCYLLYR